MKDAILVGLETTARIINRCRIYESLYLHIPTEASEDLKNTMVELYTSILAFIMKAHARSQGYILPDNDIVYGFHRLTLKQTISSRLCSRLRTYLHIFK